MKNFHSQQSKIFLTKSALVLLLVVGFLTFTANTANAVYESLSQTGAANASLTGAVSGTTLNISGTVAGAEYRYQWECSDGFGAVSAPAYGHVDPDPTYVSGATLIAYTVTVPGSGVTGGDCSGLTPVDDSLYARAAYSFSGTKDISAYTPGSWTTNVNFNNPGVAGGGGSAAYGFAGSVSFAVSGGTTAHDGTIAVSASSCSVTPTWEINDSRLDKYSGSGSTVQAVSEPPLGTDTFSFTVKTPASGFTVTDSDGGNGSALIVSSDQTKIITINCKPDLTSSVSAPVTVNSGQFAAWPASTSNASTATANAAASTTSVQMVFGANGAGSYAGYTGGYTDARATAAIAPGGSVVPTPGITGYALFTPVDFVYSVRACADSAGVVSESNEANNCGPWQNVVVLADTGGYSGAVCGTTVAGGCGGGTINGTCAASHYSCATGTSANPVAGSSGWTWNCNGSGGGSNASCSESSTGPQNGSCGASQYSCNSGTLSGTLYSGGTYTWNCNGSGGGTNASCSIYNPGFPAAAVCSPTHYGCLVSSTSAGEGGNATNWTWTCVGVNGGANAACTESKSSPTVPGACYTGFSGGYTKHYKCDVGTSINNSDANPNQWSWTCTGSNGGLDASCYEGKPPANGICGTSYNSCTAGYVGNQSSVNTGVSVVYNWDCLGINGGNNAGYDPDVPSDGVGYCSATVSCANGAVNYPICTIRADGTCLNGKANPPVCASKKPTVKEN